MQPSDVTRAQKIMQHTLVHQAMSPHLEQVQKHNHTGNQCSVRLCLDGSKPVNFHICLCSLLNCCGETQHSTGATYHTTAPDSSSALDLASSWPASSGALATGGMLSLPAVSCHSGVLDMLGCRAAGQCVPI